MDTAAPAVVVRTAHPASAIAYQRFLAMTDGWSELNGAQYESDASWATILTDAEGAGFNVELNDNDTCAVFTRETPNGPVAVMCVREWREEFHVVIGAATRPAADAAQAAFGKFLPQINTASADTINMTFWSYHPMYGGQSFNRRIDRSAWSAVERNYPTGLRERLAALCALRTQPSGGRLMVFHGPPGTGKSRYLQTLATEWAEWCSVHYVVDPDMMFADAAYMTRVMLADAYDDTDRWRLVVVEDGDEFIAKNAKARSGHAIAKLLNVADGLVGQGLRVMVLVSTNVRNNQFNTAIVRPGRCGAQVEFPMFAPDEATEWCLSNGVAEPPAFTDPVTLARLYEIVGP